MKKCLNQYIVSMVLSLLFLFLNLGNSSLAQDESGQIVIGETVKLQSGILNEDRPLLIYLPDGYKESNDRYPVLYLLDGMAHFHHTTGIIQYLSARGITPPMIVVGLVNTARGRDFSPVKLEQFPNTGGSDKFLQFVSDELIPFIDGKYRTHPHRILAGHSSGGTFTLYALLNDPDLFNFYIAISPAIVLYNTLLIRDVDTILADRSTLNKYLYITVGDEPEFRKDIQDFIKILKNNAADDLRWEFIDLEGEDHILTPHLSIYYGLETVFSDWRLPDNVLEKGIEAINVYYENLSQKYGFEIHVRMQTLNALGFSLLQENKFDDAIRVLDYCTNVYPDFWIAYHNLAYCYQQTGERELAIINYEKTLQLNPNNKAAMERLKILKDKDKE
ncbi:alpha/beta hydrolase-fold protein [candidate division KSB1 bacterium]